MNAAARLNESSDNHLTLYQASPCLQPTPLFAISKGLLMEYYET